MTTIDGQIEIIRRGCDELLREPELREKLAIRRRGQQKAPTKVVTTIRLDADVLEALRASGKGWQSRVNDALRDLVKLAA